MRGGSHISWRDNDHSDGWTFVTGKVLKRRVVQLPNGLLKKPLDWFEEVTMAFVVVRGAEFLAKIPPKRPFDWAGSALTKVALGGMAGLAAERGVRPGIREN